VMVYVDTGRPAWKGRLTSGDFFGTTLLLGLSGTAVLVKLFHEPSAGVLIGATLALRTALFVWRELEAEIAMANQNSPVRLNARISRELLRVVNRTDALSVIGLAVFSLIAFAKPAETFWALLCLLTVFAGELACRYQFFVASAGKRMPGGPVA
jgi:DMSO reductase anchor subunit